MRASKHVLLIDPRPVVSDVLAYAVRCWGYRVTRATTAKGFRVASLAAPIDGIYVVSVYPLNEKERKQIMNLARRCGGVPWSYSENISSRLPSEIREDLRTLTMRKRPEKHGNLTRIWASKVYKP